MKGIVFTGLLEMLEESYGYEFVDELISEADLPSGGVYTSIGTYDFSELTTLLKALSQKSGAPIPDLLQTYGKYFSNILFTNYAHFIEHAIDLFEFLESIETYIHVEVKKLYPEAQLPSFEAKREGRDILILTYTSERKMAYFALGLIESAAIRFNEQVDIKMKNLNEDGSIVEFTVKKR